MRLKNKANLTPEAFFRACDFKYEKKVSNEYFKLQLAKYKLQLSRGQQSRLVIILDEDMEGTISLQEFYDALEAYECEGEEHQPIDGSNFHVHF